MALRPGLLPPDEPLLRSSGDEVGLGALRGEAVLLVFLRHLG